MITLFHNPSSPASIRAHTILKQAAGNAQSTATIDQAADHSKQSKTERTDFELGTSIGHRNETIRSSWHEKKLNVGADVIEGAPTTDQLTNVLEYLGPNKIGNVVKDATGSSDAMRKFNASATAFQRPVTVDWSNGRAGMYG